MQHTAEAVTEAAEHEAHWTGHWAWVGRDWKIQVDEQVAATWPASEAHGDTAYVVRSDGTRQIVTLGRAYRAPQGEYEVASVRDLDEIDWADYDR